MKVNERAGAVLSADDDAVYLIGYGVYVGDEIPPSNITMMGIPVERPNPKIQLDNGKVVWGCECWWGAEQGVKNFIGNRKVIEVDIDEARTRARGGP